MARKTLLVLTVALAVMAAAGSQAAQSPQIPIAGSAIPQFAQALPRLSVQTGGTISTALGNQALTITMCEFWANVLPPGTLVAGQQPKTRVWGYIVGNSCPAAGPDDPGLDTYTGPVLVNQRGGFSTDLTFVNNLGTTATTKVLAYKYSTDQTLHWADPLSAEMNDCNHMAMFPAYGSACAQNYAGPIPAVVHLHGGEVPPELDGGPDAWFTSNAVNASHGHGFYSFDNNTTGNYSIYKYPNTQEASPIWFHDHTLGATRLNVYMGLAGGYVIEDPTIIPIGATGNWVSTPSCTSNCLPINLPGSADIIPVVIQDRMFDTNGQLFFPADSAGGVLSSTNPEHPYWVPEFVGDTILVNGKAWPFLNVQAKRYRFLFLNGSNARTYEMSLLNQATGAVGPAMWVIGTDGGYLDAPVKVDPALGQKLLMQPGERYEVIIDFSGFANTNLIIRNTGRTPFPKGAPPQGSTLGRIIQFRVGAAPASDPTYNPLTDGALRTGSEAIKRLPGTPGGPAIVTAAVPTQNVQKTRALTLNEVMGMAQTVTDPVTGVLTAYPGGPLEILVNNTKWGGKRIVGVTDGMYDMVPIPGFTDVTLNGITTYYSELPQEGDTEIWEIVNLTADAHPIHLHLVQFQLISRQNFNTANYTKAYAAAFLGGGYDPMTGLPYPAGVFIPGFGPPLNYNPSLASGGKYGGNPDATPFLQGAAQLPLLHERGWKDTVIAYPGQVTRLAVRWAPTDLAVQTTPNLASLFFPFDPSDLNGHGYVWHCHIVDHEDNEMMRPDKVELNTAAPAPSTRPKRIGRDY